MEESVMPDAAEPGRAPQWPDGQLNGKECPFVREMFLAVTECTLQ